MRKTTGFLEYGREVERGGAPEERIKNWDEFHTPLSEGEQRHQGAKCMDCGVPFCQSGMTIGSMASGYPLYNLVSKRNGPVYTGNWKQTYNRLKKTNSFPEFTSRVCPAPCEAACACDLYGDAVTMKENEKAIIEKVYNSGYTLPNPPSVRTGKRMAVIRSDPADLAAANQLNKRGHRVTAFEQNDRVGGLLMYGVPNMKLEKWVIGRKMDVMKKEGVTFVTGTDVGRNYQVNRIRKESNHIILACGAFDPGDIDVPGRDSANIHFAVDFLKVTTKSLLDSGLEDGSHISVRDEHVLVIGSRDTGNDCVGTPIRHSCALVTQLKVMPEPPVERAESNAWPEWPRILKIDYGQEEAISVFGLDPRQCQTTVKEFIKDEEGKVCKAIITNLVPRKDEGTDHTVMAAVEGNECEIPADLVLIAAGFTGTQAYVADAFGVELDARANMTTERDAYRTSANQIFTAGDTHRGQSLVVWTMQGGREVAKAVDGDMMGYTNPT